MQTRSACPSTPCARSLFGTTSTLARRSLRPFAIAWGHRQSVNQRPTLCQRGDLPACLLSRRSAPTSPAPAVAARSTSSAKVDLALDEVRPPTLASECGGPRVQHQPGPKIGRASCRERVGKYG